MPAAIPVIGSALLQSRSARKAEEAQTAQSERGIQLLEAQRERTEQALSPFIRGETPAQQLQAQSLGLEGPEGQAAFEATLETPTTRRLREEGLRALDQRFSAVGGLGGSNRVRAAIRASQGLDVAQAAQRRNELAAFTGQRLAPAQALAGVGSQAAGGQAQLAQGLGFAQGQAQLQRGQAFQSGLEGLGSIALSQFGKGRSGNPTNTSQTDIFLG